MFVNFETNEFEYCIVFCDHFRGVVFLEIDLNKTSVNQCDGSISLFAGSHKCRPETTQVYIFIALFSGLPNVDGNTSKMSLEHLCKKNINVIGGFCIRMI